MRRVGLEKYSSGIVSRSVLAEYARWQTRERGSVIVAAKLWVDDWWDWGRTASDWREEANQSPVVDGGLHFRGGVVRQSFLIGIESCTLLIRDGSTMVWLIPINLVGNHITSSVIRIPLRVVSFEVVAVILTVGARIDLGTDSTLASKDGQEERTFSWAMQLTGTRSSRVDVDAVLIVKEKSRISGGCYCICRDPLKVPIPLGSQLWPSYTTKSKADFNLVSRVGDNVVLIAGTSRDSVEQHTIFRGRLEFTIRKVRLSNNSRG